MPPAWITVSKGAKAVASCDTEAATRSSGSRAICWERYVASSVAREEEGVLMVLGRSARVRGVVVAEYEGCVRREVMMAAPSSPAPRMRMGLVVGVGVVILRVWCGDVVGVAWSRSCAGLDFVCRNGSSGRVVGRGPPSGS